MMLLGFIWAFAAPLLILPVWALMIKLLRPSGWSRNQRIAISLALVVIPVYTVWWINYRQFTAICEKIGKPQFFTRATADGIYLDSPTANSFGMNYLHQQGFSWMEMRGIYDRTKIERVTRDPNGQIRTEPVEGISARYEVRETFEQPKPHTGLSMVRVIDRQTGAIMAQAGNAHFSGGRMKWVLGMYGSRTYPSAMSSSEDFRNFYYLAQRTLRPHSEVK